jgi:hypothetical protein
MLGPPLVLHPLPHWYDHYDDKIDKHDKSDSKTRNRQQQLLARLQQATNPEGNVSLPGGCGP